MKNHDIHENKNVCPEFNGEKMHEQKHNNKTNGKGIYGFCRFCFSKAMSRLTIDLGCFLLDKLVFIGEFMPFFVVQQRMAKKMHQGLRPWNPTAPFLCYCKKRAEILFHINDAPRTTISSLALRGKNSPLNKLLLIICFSPKVCKASVFLIYLFSNF